MKICMESYVVSFVPDNLNIFYLGVIPNTPMNLPLSFFWHVILHELVDLKMYVYMCFRTTLCPEL